MNYQSIYDSIISRAKNRTLQGYVERHHIIPKCLGGSNHKDNLVELTAREHYICHKILCILYPSINKLTYALWMMTNCHNKHRADHITISSRDYERVRLLYIDAHKRRIREPLSEQTKLKISKANSGHNVSDVTRKRISNALKGKPSTWTGRCHSNESRKKMSEAASKRIVAEETKKKMSASRIGKRHTEESKLKMSLAARGPKPKYICSICSKEIGGKSNIIRHEQSHKK